MSLTPDAEPAVHAPEPDRAPAHARRPDARDERGAEREAVREEESVGMWDPEPAAAPARPDDVRIASVPAPAAGAEARLRRLLETTPSAILEFDAEGRVTYANAAAERILRLSSAEIVRRDYRAPAWHSTTDDGRPIAPEDLPVARALRGETVVGYEHAVQDPATGERLLLSVNAAPVRDDAGRITGALSAFVELTERRRVEEALAQSEATQRLLAEAGARLGAASLDEHATLHVAAQLAVPAVADWCFVDVVEDDGVVRRVAVAHADPAGAELARRLRRDYAPLPGAEGGVTQVVGSGRTLVVREVDDARLAALARDPEHLAALRALGMRAYVTVPLAARGRTLGALSFVVCAPGRELRGRDVALCEELGRRVALALDNALLLRQAAAARAEAESASAAKSQFLATMSHEIRTPINAIQGYAQLMELGLAGPVTDPQRDYLARLHASSQHLLGLVDDVLDLAKVDAGELRVAREALLTGPPVAATLDLTRPRAAARGVRLVAPPPGQLFVPFLGDEHRVRQILLNLLSNAVKFSERDGAVAVRCGVADAAPSARLQGGPWAYVSVEDEGVGIPAHEVAHVFEPFHQAERGHTRTKGGTGLGLAIGRRLARLMGGDVTLESAPGVGSTFTLWLPMPGAGAAARGGAVAAALAGGEGPHPKRGLAEVGLLLRQRLDELLDTIGARLRAEPALPHAAQLRRAELENHHLAFLSDAAQTLVVLDDAEGREAELLRDSSTIQRVLAELHGRTRQKQGWPIEALKREYAIIAETLDEAVRRQAGERPGSATARELLAGLVSRACEAAGRALRHAGEQVERK